MSTYNDGTQIGNDSEKTDESTQRTLEEIEQEVNQLKFNTRHRQRVQKLKSGELDRDDLDVIPFYYPDEWDSYEQYKQIVGGVPGVRGGT
jgi:hypothetical protein